MISVMRSVESNGGFNASSPGVGKTARMAAPAEVSESQLMYHRSDRLTRRFEFTVFDVREIP